MDDETARRIVLRHAEEVLELAGWAGYASGDSQPIPCRQPDGRDSATVHYTAGSFQLVVPLDQQRALIERVAQGWAQQGYTVTPVTTFADGGARVTAQADEEFVEMTLGSGAPPAMVLAIVTACYRLRPDTPEIGHSG